MDLIKGIAAALLSVVIVAFGLTIGFLISVVLSVMSFLAMVGMIIVGVAVAIYETIRSPSP